MSLKIPRSFWKFFGVLFTTIIAPMTVRHLDTPSEIIPPPSIPATISASYYQPTTTTRIVAQGTGSTPEAAFENGIDNAIRIALEKEVGAAEWNRHAKFYLAMVRRDGSGILHGWHELSSGSEWHLKGRVFRSEVACDVDEFALREKLHPH